MNKFMNKLIRTMRPFHSVDEGLGFRIVRGKDGSFEEVQRKRLDLIKVT